MELGAGVPANWIVLVVGVIVDWAFAEKVANAKTARQNKPAANFPCETDLLGVNDARATEGLTLGLPVPETLAPGIFSDIQESIIQTAGLAVCSTICIRKALLTVRVKTKEQSTVLEIYLQRFTRVFGAEKAGQRADPLI
jgi:hypothetical protein